MVVRPLDVDSSLSIASSSFMVSEPSTMASSNANSQQIPFTQSPLLLLSNMSNLMSIKLASITLFGNSNSL
jgi:hypothetical protein